MSSKHIINTQSQNSAAVSTASISLSQLIISSTCHQTEILSSCDSGVLSKAKQAKRASKEYYPGLSWEAATEAPAKYKFTNGVVNIEMNLSPT